MTDLMAKDLDLVIVHAAKARTPLFTAGVVRQILGAASEAGYGREDFSALAKVLRDLGQNATRPAPRADDALRAVRSMDD